MHVTYFFDVDDREHSWVIIGFLKMWILYLPVELVGSVAEVEFVRHDSDISLDRPILEK